MTTIQFRGIPTPPGVDALEDPWLSGEWRLAGERSGVGEDVRADVSDQDVLELETESGTSVLLADDQLSSYGFDPNRSGDGIEIRPFLQPPDAVSRDGAGAWALRSLRLWRNPAGVAIAALAGTAQDRILGQRLGCYRVDADSLPAEKLEVVPASANPVLLLVHGTISSSPGSFGGLLTGAAWHRLRGQYGERIYGFEHRTLTEGLLDNALALTRCLAPGQILDLVTHSRGGLVAELLIRGADRGGGGFSEQEIDAFASALEPAFATETASKLRELQREIRDKGLKIRRIVRVAAPMRGTTILSGRLDRWTSTTLNLIRMGFRASGQIAVGEAIRAARHFLLELTRQRELPGVLPGLEAMRPESPWVALLNPPPDLRVSVPTFVIAGDHVGKGLLHWLADRFSDSFYGGANDWVVNTPSMTGGATREGGIHRALFRDPDTTHITYFDRDLVRSRILDALERGTEASSYERVGREVVDIARGGRVTKAKAGAPIALLLPGITGSHLQLGKQRIWLQILQLALGHLGKLKVGAEGVTSNGWIDPTYEAFADFLAKTHEVRPFAYDWRLSIAESGATFGAILSAALEEARARDQPVHIFAHSMGGLVARVALAKDGLWHRFEDRKGSRLVLLGTPNAGSHSIPWLLMGNEKTLRMLARVDFKHDRRDLVEIFRQFPGILELMPFGDWSDRNYFGAAFWQGLAEELSEANQRWPIPDDASLQGCATVLSSLAQSELAGRPVAYVAGYNPEGTISDITVDQATGRRVAHRILQGDGRVLWSSGIPRNVQTYFVNAVHGDLTKHKSAFDGYLDLAVRGATSLLSAAPPVALEGRDSVARSRGLAGSASPEVEEPLLLYPTEGDLVAAAMGGSVVPDGSEGTDLVEVPPVDMCLVHGSFVAARAPVLIGHYENDAELRSALLVLDGLLGGALQDALTLNCLPRDLGGVHLAGSAREGPSLGAIVVGLGRVGELSPNELQQALTRGLLKFVINSSERGRGPTVASVDVACVLVGSGDFGVSIEGAVQAMLGAVDDVQRDVCKRRRSSARSLPCLGRVQLYEIDETRAERIADAMTRILENESLAVRFSSEITRGEQGQRTFLTGIAGGGFTQRVVIRAPRGIEEGLEFTVINRSARSDFSREPGQGQFVSRMLELATESTADQRGLSRALYELITPNDYKLQLGNVDRLIVNVDEAAAGVPWELMRDDHSSGEPLAVRTRLVRQLIRSPRTSAARTTVDRALVIGDTENGGNYSRLEGARAEMKIVRDVLGGAGLPVEATEGIRGLDLLGRLLTESYGILHIAAHGDWVSVTGDEVMSREGIRHAPPSGRTSEGDSVSPRTGGRISGVVLDNGLLLTSRQIAKLPRVPELVFLNCCHLGGTSQDASLTPRSGRRMTPWPELASSLAVAFIDRGAKAVIAAGWAVNDAAAGTFAKAFYDKLLAGEDLATAVLEARKQTFRRHEHHNTWGAYQAYGDDGYRLLLGKNGPLGPRGRRRMITTRLSALDALQGLIGKIQYQQKLQVSFPNQEFPPADPAELVERLSPPLLRDSEVRAVIGRAFQHARRRAEAIEHLSAAVGLGRASFPVEDVEQLANLETREAATRAEQAFADFQASAVDPAGGEDPLAGSLALLAQGRSRIENLGKALPDTVERLSLLGSALKRTAWVESIAALMQGNHEHLPQSSLRKAIRAYEKAVKAVAHPLGHKDHYPTNNLAQLKWLEAVLANAAPTGLATNLRDLADAARADAVRRCQTGGDFWDHAAQVDCALTAALAAETTFPVSTTNGAEIGRRLLAAMDPARSDIRRRFGNDYKNASPGEQLQFIAAMLRWRAADDDAGAAVAEIYLEAIRALSEGLGREPQQGEAALSPASPQSATSPGSGQLARTTARLSSPLGGRKAQARKRGRKQAAPATGRTRGPTVPPKKAPESE